MRSDVNLGIAIILTYIVHLISGQSNGITFQNVPQTLNINETTPVQNNILMFSVTNSNPNDNPLTVTCINSTSQIACETFRITALNANPRNWNGNLYLNRQLDYRQMSSYSLQLSASNGPVNPTIVNIAINVIATRYRPPMFVGNNIIEIAERPTASSEPILRFQAQAPDNVASGFSIHYRIRQGMYSSYFVLDEISGVLTNSRPLQTSDQVFSEGMAVLQIEAAYQIGSTVAWGNSSTSSTTNATIYFTSSNLHAPTFDKSSYNGSIKETALPSTFVDSIFIYVTDLDRTPMAATFMLSLDRETDKFEVRPNQGYKNLEARISLISGVNFSYNDGPRQFTFNVIATEMASTERRSSRSSVTVNLVQVNRYPPIFFQNPYRVNISETSPADTTVVQVKAWDRDVGPLFGNESIRYKIAQGARDLFRMNEYGLMTVARCRNPGLFPCLDYEREDLRSYRLIVYATDILGEGFTSTATVDVDLWNENDNPPIWGYPVYRGVINDSSTTLTILPAPIQATDADRDRITYSIRSGNLNGLWSINSSTGAITPVRPIQYSDAPSNGSFLLTIQASDGSPLHDVLANVNISVVPVNRFAPVFTQKVYNVTMPKSQQPNTRITQVVAIDNDPPTTPGGIVTYRLVSGGQDVFDVHPNTGVIILKVPLDQLTPTNYTLQIEANDQGSPPLKDTTTVYINILPTPLFLQNVDITINDDSPIGYNVVTMTAQTSVQNPSLQYSFIGPAEGFDVNMNQITNFTNDDRNMFMLNPNDGIIQVSRNLNSERIPIWRSVVQVVERTSNPILTATGTVTIRMFPTNKKPPVFNPPWTERSPFYNLTINQGNIMRPEVASYSAISPNQLLTISYQLIDPQNYFRLQSPSSGIIIQQVPIFDNMASYVLQLIATDNGQPPLNSTATIYVTISSSNLYPPEFNQSVYTASIYENVPPNTPVVQVYATDRDSGDYGLIKYSIDSSVNTSFTIHPETGLITVASGANFDAARRLIYEFIVTALDSPARPSVQKFATAYVNVTIIDTNDHSPVFTSLGYRITVLDSLPVKSFVIQTFATDGDLGLNAQITYAIVSGNNNDMFSINQEGNITLEKSLLGGLTQYVLNVSATDGGTPSRSTYAPVYIFVTSTCGSLCNPVWTRPSSLNTYINVSESQGVGYIIYSLSANNYQNQAGSIAFAFLNPGGRSSTFENFNIANASSNGANITIATPLNYGVKNVYSFQVEAVDAYVFQSSVSRYFTVYVLPSYTYNPQFGFDKQTFCTIPVAKEITSNYVIGSSVTKVTAATKYPNDQVTYSIIENSNPALFSINSQTGEITLSSPPEIGTYNLTVNARYPQNVVQTTNLCNNRVDQSNVSLVVNIIEMKPVYISTSIQFCIDNSLETGATVFRLNSELKTNDLGQVSYTEDIANTYLKVQSNGNVDLKNAAASIKENPTILQVTSFLIQNPTKGVPLTATGHLVNRPTDLTLITLKMPLMTFLQSGRQTFMNDIGRYGYVCYVDASYHTTDQGAFNTQQTDVFVYIINKTTNAVVAPLALDQMIKTATQRKSANIIGITGAVGKWDGFNYKPVAIAIGLIIGLLLLCFLFFCCCCLWPFIAKYCLAGAENEPFIAKSMASGIANKDWAIPSQNLEQQNLNMDVPDTDNKMTGMHDQFGGDFGDEDILQAESFKSRREDSATMDGLVSNEGLQTALPAGFVHIEAPLAPSRNASALGASDAAGKSGNAFKSVTETTLRESYERGTSQTAKMAYTNQDDVNRHSMYPVGTRKNGPFGDGEDDEDQGPVQLNNVSNLGSQNMIGATLIKPEPVGGMTQVQSIISGNDPVFVNAQNNLPGYEYSNYSSTFATDPSRSNLAYSNEVVFSGLRPVSHYEEVQGSLQPRNDLLMNPMAGGTRQESSFMERFEETRFL